jgi:hypothetical protein
VKNRMPHLSELMGGKATKRSRFGSVWKSHQIGTRRSAEVCQKAHLKYHVLDSEWIWHYLTPEEAKDLATRFHDVTTVLSFSSRHNGALKILRKTLETGISDRIALDLVAGNKAYLTRNEAKRKPAKALIETVKFTRRHFQGQIFVGTEGMWKASAQLAAEYDLIPFLLLDRSPEEGAAHFKDAIGKKEAVALYMPYLISENYPRLLDDVLQKLGGYIFRREWVQKGLKDLGVDPSQPDIRAIIKDKQKVTSKFLESRHGDFLRSAASTLAAYGTSEAVTERIEALHKSGYDIIIGYPIKENTEQTLAFGDCLRMVVED